MLAKQWNLWFISEGMGCHGRTVFLLYVAYSRNDKTRGREMNWGAVIVQAKKEGLKYGIVIGAKLKAKDGFETFV